MRRGMALMGVLVLLLLLRGPALMSVVLSSAGMLMLRNGLMAQADFVPSTYPVYQVLDGTSATARTMRSLRYAVALSGDNPSAQWALGRAALAVGDVDTAASVLEPLMGKVGHNPLLYYDALFALSYGRQPERVIALYESVPPLQPTRAISDAVVLAYLDLATGRQGDKGTGGQGDKEWEEEGKARQWLERAQRMRPGDLYANYCLWRRAREAGDVEAAAMYSETLAYFPLEAINPADDRLLDYVADAVPGLLEERLWDREKTLNVVSFLVWRHHGAAGVERLLERLIERYPSEPDWVFYLAELYHRQGSLAQAKAVYQQVLAVDPAFIQAYLRLGMVAEAGCKSQMASCEGLEEAAGWYKQYNDLAPDDLLGLRKLAEIYETLGRPEATVLREELEARTSGQRIAAELLGVPEQNVELGPNLVENGEFETREGVNPAGWQLGLYLGQAGDGGLYVAGEDILATEGNAIRFVTLWGGLMPDGAMTFAEYVGKSFPVTDTKYLVSLYYCSRYFIEGSGLAFLGDYARSGGLVLAYYSLPHSGGQWRVVHTLVDGPSASTSVVPLVRDWGVGQLWVQAFVVRPIVYMKDLYR
jgi:tetratricopeptide (TPR) repeat protein